MSLHDHRSAVLRRLLSHGSDLKEDGLHARWDLYRAMVRNRLEDLVRAAFPRTAKALGDSFARAFDAWLAESAPRTPYFWRIASEFGPFLDAWIVERDPRPWLPELVRLETTVWNVRHEDFTAAADVTELAFELAPVVSPSLALLDVAFAVESEFVDAPEAKHATLAIVRRANDAVATISLNESAAALVRALVDGEGTLADRALAVAEARDTLIDEAYFEALATLLALLVEEGVMLGSRAAR